MVETQFHVVVKRLCIDSSMELGSSNVGKQYFQDQTILHQISTAYTLQQNILVERKRRHMLNVARALYNQTCVGHSFFRIVCKNYNLFDQSYTISCLA